MTNARPEEAYRDRGGYWEEDHKDCATWGYEECNGYHENSKDFSALGYKDCGGYHQDIKNRAT